MGRRTWAPPLAAACSLGGHARACLGQRLPTEDRRRAASPCTASSSSRRSTSGHAAGTGAVGTGDDDAHARAASPSESWPG